MQALWVLRVPQAQGRLPVTWQHHAASAAWWGGLSLGKVQPGGTCVQVVMPDARVTLALSPPRWVVAMVAVHQHTSLKLLPLCCCK